MPAAGKKEYFASGAGAYRELYGLIPLVPVLIIAGLAIHPVTLIAPVVLLALAVCLVIRSRTYPVIVLDNGELRSPKWLRRSVPLTAVTSVRKCRFGDVEVMVNFNRVRLPTGLLCASDREALLDTIRDRMQTPKPDEAAFA